MLFGLIFLFKSCFCVTIEIKRTKDRDTHLQGGRESEEVRREGGKQRKKKTVVSKT